MSISLNITADNYSELKTKAFEALGLTNPAQTPLPFPMTAGHPPISDTSAQTGSEVSVQQTAAPVETKTKSAPLAGLVDKQKRTRRTKAEVEAERKTKNVNATPATTIQNNFEASDEIEDINESTVSEDADVVVEAANDNSDYPTKTYDECKDILKRLLKNPGGEGTKTAMKLFEKFGIGKLVEMDESRFGEFYALAEKELK